MKAFIAQNTQGEFYIHKGQGVPKKLVCAAPLINGEVAKSWQFQFVNIQDVKHPTTEEVIGKEAIVDQAAYDAFLASEEAAKTAKEDAKAAKLAPLKTLKTELLALSASNLTNTTELASAILKLRDGLAALEKEMFNLETT